MCTLSTALDLQKAELIQLWRNSSRGAPVLVALSGKEEDSVIKKELSFCSFARRIPGIDPHDWVMNAANNVASNII